LRYVLEVAIFAASYIALDWASYIEPLGPFNITPWNPQPALAVVWVSIAGAMQAPAIFLTIVLSDVVVRHAPGGYAVTLASSFVLAAGYTAMGLLLGSVLRERGLRRTRDLTLFSVTTVAGTGLIGIAFVGVLKLSGVLGDVPTLQATYRFWLGDAAGMLVTAPLLFAAADEPGRRDLGLLVRRREPWIQWMVLCGALWLVLHVLPGQPVTHFFYVLFLPIIWIAMRSGITGAIVAMGIVQVGLILAIRKALFDLPIVEVQILVPALTVTGLFLGVVVDERERAESELRESLRLAAAGEMAGAIAHEVNQPLTALTNYGRSAQILLRRDGAATEQLREVLDKILYEANRASDVVRRLRDFFRTGTTRLEPVAVTELLDVIKQIAESVVGEREISVERTAERDLPAVLIDRLQVELVLRNLLANAVDSLTMAARGKGSIRIDISRHDGESIRLVVADNGPGVPVHERETVFRPFVSGKPTGMGLGLTVSQAIAKAHGGSLQVADSEHGEFHLVLPCVPKH